MKSIELFAGAGGLALGLEQAGFENELLVELDKYACQTLSENRVEWNVLNQDIRDVSFKQYKNKIDLLTGGFPCQAFSHAGKRLGFEDIRGTLFFQMARAIKEIKPKMILAENVRGFATHDKGNTLQTVLDVLDELGYNTYHQLVNSWNYNVPQKRERYIIVALKKSLYKNKTFNFPKTVDAHPVLRDALFKVPQSKCGTYSENKLRFFKKIPPGGNWKNLPEQLQKEYLGKSFYSGGGKTGILKRLHMDEPSMTILTSPTQKQTERCHPSEDRPLTIRESARIQTFPDNWKFIGSVANQYKQIGNAVPVNLAFHLGNQLFDFLKNN
jgi:DNA (cytosine-5)-methyltransferase 1